MTKMHEKEYILAPPIAFSALGSIGGGMSLEAPETPPKANTSESFGPKRIHRIREHLRTQAVDVIPKSPPEKPRSGTRGK